jgi:hypothetical protein
LADELRAAMPRDQQDPAPEQVARVLESFPSINIHAGNHASVEVHARSRSHITAGGPVPASSGGGGGHKDAVGRELV